MKYRKRTDGSLVTKSQLRAGNAGTSLPKVWKAATLDFLGVDPVLSSTPTVPGQYQFTTPDGVVQDSSGNWIQAWQVKDMFTADSDGYGVVTTTVSEKEDAYDSDQLQIRRRNMTASNANLRLAINALGEYNNIVTSSNLTSNPELEIRFNHTANINRLDPWLLQATQGILDSAQLDTIFENASSY